MRSILSFIEFLIYPIWLPYATYRNKEKNSTSKALTLFFSLVILLPIWVGGYFFVTLAVFYSMEYLGVKKTAIPVTGPSMLPTFLEEGMVPVRHYPQFSATIKKYIDVKKLQPVLKRGDVVVFRNQQTNKVFEEQHEDLTKRGGFVKRIIGIAGDTVRIENGYVYLNGKMIPEPYILKARSTFGSTSILDCQEIHVPQNKYLVLGDNRKISVDSRQIGLIDTKDVYYFLPFKDQVPEYGKRWRDTSNDSTSAVSSELDATKYVQLLNEKRKNAGREPLKFNSKLSQSAKLRAEVMLKYDDTSFEATRSGFTMEDAMDQVGYTNVITGEFPIVGYYDAQELIDALFEYPNSRDYMLERDYQEIGISTFVGKRNGCPVQIVVQHLAGYKPPNYAVKEIEEYKTLIDKLNEIKDGWSGLKNEASSKEFYDANKKDVDRINEIIELRQARVQQIIKRMEANEWYTPEEREFIKQDSVLVDEQNRIAEELNKRIRGE